MVVRISSFDAVNVCFGVAMACGSCGSSFVEKCGMSKTDRHYIWSIGGGMSRIVDCGGCGD